MKENKFRWWDSETVSMVSWEEMQSEEGRRSIGIHNFGLDVLVKDADLIPMQYIGVKDKNGKEIYEDDIVQWSIEQYYEPYKKTFKGKIIWFDSGLQARFTGWGVDVPLLTPMDFKTLEVIGNIYEDPELIK